MTECREEFSLIRDIKFKSVAPQVSVVIPFFNREHDLQINLNQLLSSLEVPCEFILINDSSEDNTLQLLKNWAESTPAEQDVLVGIQLYTSKKQQFETRCDDFGIRVSRAKFVLEIQADMLIQDLGFDARYLRAMKSHRELIAISGRGCHTFHEIAVAYNLSMGAATFDDMNLASFLRNRLRTFLRIFLSPFFSRGRNSKALNSLEDNKPLTTEEIYPSMSHFENFGRAGKLGNLVEIIGDTPEEFRNSVWISDTVMRGPLFLDKTKYLDIGGFNLENFFLGYDEHDLFLRAAQHGYRCGYVATDFKSPLNTGSTRSRRTLRTELALTRNVLRIQIGRQRTALKMFHMSNVNLSRLIKTF